MSIYKIKLSSPWLFVITLLAVMFAGSAIMVAVEKQMAIGRSVAILLPVVAIMFLSFYLAKLTSTAECEIILNDNGFERKWIRPFLLGKKADLKILFIEIKNYKFEPSQQFDTLTIKLRNGKKYRLYHNRDFKNDDYSLFVSNFESQISSFNLGTEGCQILLAKNIFERKVGLILALSALAAMIIFPLLIWLSPNKGRLNWGSLLSFYGIAIFFVTQVYLSRKKLKSN